MINKPFVTHERCPKIADFTAFSRGCSIKARENYRIGLTRGVVNGVCIKNMQTLTNICAQLLAKPPQRCYHWGQYRTFEH